MSEYTAYFRAQLLGKSETLRDIKEVYSEFRRLDGQKVELKIDMRNAQNQIKELQAHLNELYANKNRRLAAGESLKDMKDLDAEIKTTTADIQELRAAMQMKGISMNNIQNELDETRQHIKEIDAELEQERILQLDADNAKVELMSVQDMLENIGGLMQGLGGAMEGFSGFMGNSIGKAFSDMSDMFGIPITKYAAQRLTELGTEMFLGNLQSASQRFDILSTYQDYMGIMGVDEATANASLGRVNQAIQGLPVGLSDVAYQVRKYNMYLDDVDKSTDLAIGLNQALIAGGASEQMRTTAAYEIDRLLAVGKLNTARQWNALLQGLGVSVKYLQENMGATDMTMNEFVDALTKGDITTQEFLEGLESLADSDNLNEALEIYKGTIESAMSNLQFALIRGKANIMDALNETLEDVTGTGLAGWINNVRDQVNEIFTGISNYIKDNPELIETALEKIQGVFERAKEFDWAGTADKIFTALGKMIDIVTDIWDQLPEGAVSDFVSFAMTWAGPLGNAFQALSGGLPFMFALFERMKDFDYASLAENVFDAVGRVIDRLVGLMNLIPDGALEKIITFGLVYASPMGKAISGIGKLISTFANMKFLGMFGGIGKSGEAIGAIGLTNFKAILLQFTSVVSVLGETLLAGGTLRLLAGWAEDIGQMDFGNLASNIEQLGPVLANIIGLVAVLTGAFGALHYKTGGVGTIAAAIGELLTAGFIGLIAEAGMAIKELATGANAVSEVDIPSESKIEKLGSAIKAIVKNFVLNPNDASTVAQNRPVFANLAGIVDDIADIGKSMVAISQLDMSENQIRETGNKAEELMIAVGKIFKQLDTTFETQDGMLAMYDETKTGSLAAILMNMNTAIGNLKLIADTVSGMSPVLASLENDWVGNGTTRLDLFRERVGTFIKDVGQMFVDIKTAFTGGETGDTATDFSALSWADSQSGEVGNILTNMTTALTSLADIATGVENSSAQMTRLMHDYTGDGSRMSAFSDHMKGFITQIGGIFNALNEAFGIKGTEYADFVSSYNSSTEVVGIMTNMESAFRSIRAIMRSIPGMVKTLDTLVADPDGFGSITYNMRKKLETVFTEIGSIFSWLSTEGALPGLISNDSAMNAKPAALEKLEQLAGSDGAMSKIGNIVTTLFNMQEKVEDLFGTLPGNRSETFMLGTQLGKIFSGLTNAFSNIGPEGDNSVYTLASRSNSLLSVIENINQIIAYLGVMEGTVKRLAGGEGEDSELGTNLGTIFTSLSTAFSELGGDAGTLEAVTGGFSDLAGELSTVQSNGADAAGAVNDLRDAVQNCADMMSGKAGTLSTFVGNLDAVRAAAHNAQGAVAALAAAISSLQDKTVTVTYRTVSEGVRTAGSAFVNNSLVTAPAHQANGGLVVYRAGGGSIFRPFGTDTVPAMLTPGEFVTRRAAVKAFGEEFMNRINNLDLSGALNSLVLRAGAGIIPRQAGVVNNYHRDNHAKVVQNFYKSNPSYGFMRASKWVKTL